MDDIVARANDTKYGLAAATEDINTALTFTSRVQARTVWLVTYTCIQLFYIHIQHISRTKAIIFEQSFYYSS